MSTYKRRFGDRKEGRLLRSLPAFSKFIPYIMPTRNDASNQYEESFEVSDVDRRLRQLRVQGYKGIGILHFIIAAYIRGVSMLPGINRFVVGRRIYARDDISELISKGSRFGIHNLVTYSSVKMLRQSRFVKLECFEHKIAFAMSRDDWSNYLERVHYLTDLDNISAVYYDGGSTTHIFRPYLIQ